MKTNKQSQADYKKRKRESGLVQKAIWVYPEDWEEINNFISKKVNKRLDIITSNDKIIPT
jgi:hypothetical protein